MYKVYLKKHLHKFCENVDLFRSYKENMLQYVHLTTKQLVCTNSAFHYVNIMAPHMELIRITVTTYMEVYHGYSFY